MILHINDNRMLREIQIDFSRFYPYLKMEFFMDPKSVDYPGAVQNKIDPYVRLGSIRNKHHAGAINIFPVTSVKELKEQMKNEFNLFVKIFHFTEHGWIDANSLDLVTINELNEQGRHIFHEMHNVSAQRKNLF